MVYRDVAVEHPPSSANNFRHATRCAHLVADSLQELHAFAEGLGLKRAWFQAGGGHPHYDLIGGGKIALADKLGCEVIGRTAMLDKAKALAVEMGGVEA